MRTLVQLSGIAALTLAGFSAQAADFGPLMDVAHSTWPARTHFAVVADYSRSQEEVANLAAAAGAGSTITVLDTRGPAQMERACTILKDRVHPDCLVLLPSDPVLWDGSFTATQVVGRMACLGVPTIATTAKALRQGAVFAMGEGTGMQLMVTDRVIGTVEVILPQKATFVNSTASARGLARITVLGAK